MLVYKFNKLFFTFFYFLPSFLLELVPVVGVEVISIVAVFGVLVLVVILFAILIMFLLRRKRKLQNSAAEAAILVAGMITYYFAQ